jgi:hypothetical protein
MINQLAFDIDARIQSRQNALRVTVTGYGRVYGDTLLNPFLGGSSGVAPVPPALRMSSDKGLSKASP